MTRSVLRVALFTLCVNCALLGRVNEPASTRVLHLLGQAVLVQDTVCARVATEQNDKALADTCAGIYSVERAALIAAASAADAGRDGDAACAAISVGVGLRQIGDELSKRGTPVPTLVSAALIALDSLAPLCQPGAS